MRNVDVRFRLVPSRTGTLAAPVLDNNVNIAHAMVENVQCDVVAGNVEHGA